jgi:hypothetical protein
VIGQPECQRVDFVPPCRRFALGHQAASGSITLLRPFLRTVHRRTSIRRSVSCHRASKIRLSDAPGEVN